MATLEQIKSYLDQQTGLYAHILLEYEPGPQKAPNGESYGFQDFFIYPANEAGLYRLDMPDFSNVWNGQYPKPREEYLLAWPMLLRALAMIDPDAGQAYLNTDKWQLDVIPERQRPRRQLRSAKNQSSQ